MLDKTLRDGVLRGTYCISAQRMTLIVLYYGQPCNHVSKAFRTNT
jgi:hypothetical protein